MKCVQAAVKYFLNDMKMSTQQTAGDTVQGGLGDVNVPLPPKGSSAMLSAFVGGIKKCKAQTAAHPTPRTHTSKCKQKGWGGQDICPCPMTSWGDAPNVFDHNRISPAASHLFWPKKCPKQSAQ